MSNKSKGANVERELVEIGLGAITRARPYSLGIVRDNIEYLVPITPLYVIQKH